MGWDGMEELKAEGASAAQPLCCSRCSSSSGLASSDLRLWICAVGGMPLAELPRLSAAPMLGCAAGPWSAPPPPDTTHHPPLPVHCTLSYHPHHLDLSSDSS